MSFVCSSVCLSVSHKRCVSAYSALQSKLSSRKLNNLEPPSVTTGDGSYVVDITTRATRFDMMTIPVQTIIPGVEHISFYQIKKLSSTPSLSTLEPFDVYAERSA